ncbi:MAG: hypothetical protein CME93_09035 [Hyphomonadaceae bacterium]|nr:hypothetical protein [Hyphomonadaceae bacterium]OUX92830.1 MAG: hypothetical protein CBB77_11335 [Hyphomonas sp. TMED17]
MNGLWEKYYENGQLFCRNQYIEDERNGLFEAYYENGQPRRRLEYIAGKEIGIWGNIMRPTS